MHLRHCHELRPSAVFDDGSCIWQGAWTTRTRTTTPTPPSKARTIAPTSQSADFNNDGLVQLADLLTFLMAYGTEGPDWGSKMDPKRRLTPLRTRTAGDRGGL